MIGGKFIALSYKKKYIYMRPSKIDILNEIELNWNLKRTEQEFKKTELEL